MRRIVSRLLLLVVFLVIYGKPAFAAFDLRGSQQIDLQAKVLDTAVSADGRWTFALMEGGVVRVLTFRGEQVQNIKTGESYDRIEFSPAGNRLILSGGDSGSILVLGLDMIHAIDIDGAPSKGPQSAPVVLAYFGDYQ